MMLFVNLGYIYFLSIMTIGKDNILLGGVFKNYSVNNNFNQGKEFKIPTTFQKK